MTANRPSTHPTNCVLARTLDGRLHGTLSLDDAAATELEKAIHNARTWDGSDDQRSVAEQQGDALFDIAAFFNKNHAGDGTPRHLPDITLSADVSTITTDTPEATNDDTGRPVSCLGSARCGVVVRWVPSRQVNSATASGRSLTVSFCLCT